MKKLLSLLLLLPALAFGQVSSGYVQGQILSSASLNNNFAQAVNINNGTLNIPNINNPIISGGTIMGSTISGVTISGITLASFVPQAANTVVANATAGSASPTAVAVPSCSGAGNALTWTSGTGFGCTTITGISPIGANTFLANETSGTAAPTAAPLPSCSTASSALLYTTSSGLSCNTSINASSLGGNAANTYAPLASPTFTGTVTIPSGASIAGFAPLVSPSFSGTWGGTTNMTITSTTPTVILNDTSSIGTPAILWESNGSNRWYLNGDNTNGVWVLNRYVSGSFQDKPLSISNATGLVSFVDGISLNSLKGSLGTTTNDSANAGSIGEYVTANATAVSLTSPATSTITSISLTAGDWDVQGETEFNAGAGAAGTSFQSSISTTAATQGGLGTRNRLQLPTGVTAGSTPYLPTPVVRISIASTTTVYLVAASTFAGGTMTCDGLIRARRVR